MREQLETLPTSQAMFLLTLMMLEGEQDLDLLHYLPDDQAPQLESIGRALCVEPRKQMLPQVVREIKHLIKTTQRSPIDHLAPEWMAEFLKEEPPQVINVILQQFPQSISDRILMALPGPVRQNLPPSREVHPDIARLVRRHFETKVPSMEPASTPAQAQALSLDSLTALDTDELLLLINELGIRELALAFRKVGRGPLTELCRRLSSQDAERLLEVIRSLETTIPSDSPDAKELTKSAQRLIQKVSLRNRSKSQLHEDAGLAKLREACWELAPEQQQKISLLLPHRIGKKFQVAQVLELKPTDKYRIQCEAIQLIQQLSMEGKIAPHWSQLEAQYPPPPAEDLPPLEPEHE